MDENDEIKREGKYYTSGPGKPPIFIQTVLYEKRMSAADFLHLTDTCLGWEEQGDDIAVIELLVTLLATWGDDLIFAFHDTMAELLYSLDTQKITGDTYKNRSFSADKFLYIRCTALINFKRYYSDVVSDRKKLEGNLSFESILSIPALTWAKVHGKPRNKYPHTTKYCYETMGNIEGWKGETERED